MTAAFLLFILAVIAISRGGAAVTSQWADLSLIWLILPFLVFAFIFLLILGALIYALARFLHILPRYTGLAQTYADLVAAKTRLFADKAASPVFFVQKTKAGIRTLFSKSPSKRTSNDGF